MITASTQPGYVSEPVTLPPHLRRTVEARPATPRVPEWPALSQREVRQIVLDILG
ncbi:hypothetical protein [Azospirillum sp. SYSU D00513]|uniref:hypothetical protein n=1 Tax=Azospirillum sp. SYSU D00513 TaxID=2812561 RepID=UPI001A972867|nr:hypothetical protein [Azospirillum sp. SYSU D00513]